jgi:hypothetical protein
MFPEEWDVESIVSCEYLGFHTGLVIKYII